MKIKLPNLSFWKCVAAILFAAGLAAVILRFARGLGAATHLSDAFPWGLWVGFDVLVGVGLAAGGFVIAATVHIFHLEKYEPISRPTILTAFLGYLLVIVAILIDLGRPYRIWHPLVMWNPHSVMFEVAWCVMFYTGVLALEFSPIVLEKFHLKTPLRLIKAIYLPVVVAGVLLSTLHQSSLGTLYVIVPDKLHGLWYSPLLPAFFFTSAIAAGLAMTIIESFLSLRSFGKQLEKPILTGLARALVVVLAFYLTFKFMDLNHRKQIHLAFETSRQSVLFWGEVGLGALLPMGLLLHSRLRTKSAVLFLSSLLVVIGFIINRLNVSITGMLHSETYLPKWSEVAITLAIVALGFSIFALAVKHFAVFPNHNPIPPQERHPVFTGNIVLSMWGLLLLVVSAYGMTRHYEKQHPPPAPEMTPANPILPAGDLPHLPDDFIYPLGPNSPGPVLFSHQRHLATQERPACGTCHAGSFHILKKEDPGSVTMEVLYQGGSCGLCHNGQTAFHVTDDCMRCHRSP